MLRWIYYTFRNLIYYRVQRQVGHRRVMNLAAAREMDDIKDAIVKCGYCGVFYVISR